MLVLAVAALAVAVIAVGFAGFSLVRLRQVQRQFLALGPDDAEHTVVSVLAKHNKRIDDALARVDAVTAQAEASSTRAGQALRNVAVVRYDAFGDMGGRLSFSAAIVDDSGNGLVISSIHARGESRTYAKELAAGESTVELTAEEMDALSKARRERTSS